jgi:hypothetical protein
MQHADSGMDLLRPRASLRSIGHLLDGERMNAPSWIERSEFARAALIDNRTRVFGLKVRNGSGNECAYCHKPIDTSAVEYEVEAMVMAGLRVLHFHRVCEHLWETAAA